MTILHGMTGLTFVILLISIAGLLEITFQIFMWAAGALNERREARDKKDEWIDKDRED